MKTLKKFKYKKLVMITTLLFVCKISISQNFYINCSINNNYDGLAFLHYFRHETNKRMTDTVEIKHGKFQFKGNVAGAEFALITTDTIYGYQFFIEPGIITVNLADETNKTSIKGSKTQDEYELLKKSTSKESKFLKSLSDSINTVRSNLKSGIISPEVAENEIKIISKKRDPVLIARRNKEINYVVKHPNSYVSILMIYSLVGYISLDSIDMLYNSISEEIKGSSMDLSFLAYNTRYRNAIAATYPFDNLKINEKAPSFLFYNTFTKDSMKLSDFNQKIIVLEFWGLFCFPCLKFNPHLEELRKKYGNENLKIIAINDNQKKELPELTTYLNKNKFLDWTHVFTNESVDQPNELINKGEFSNYVGLGVPRTIVIDKKGIVIYKKYGYTEEDLPTFNSLVEKAMSEK